MSRYCARIGHLAARLVIVVLLVSPLTAHTQVAARHQVPQDRASAPETNEPRSSAGITDPGSPGIERELGVAYSHDKVIFAENLEASASVWGITEITAVVPSGVVSGPVVVETERGLSNASSFAVGSLSVPDDSGEGTSWSTDVSGTISSDTTWSSNVRVTGDVEVSAGATLTIVPGVTVFFAANSDDRASGVWTNKAEIQVWGTLVAEGTQAFPIYFTSDATTPATGDWGGIVVRRYSTDSSLSRCVIHYAENGVRFHADRESSGTLSGRISQCRIEDNVTGIYMWVQPEGSTSYLIIADPTVTNSLIRDNDDYGLFIVDATGWGTATNYTLIEGNVFEGNGVGMRLGASSWWQGHVDHYPEVRNNTVRNSADCGVIVKATGSSDLSGSDTDSRPLIEHNLLEDNGTNILLHLEPMGSDGVQLLSATIRHNTIRDATHGIVFDDDEPYGTLMATIRHNVFYGLSGYAVDNRTSRPVDASLNYWGSTVAEWDAGAQVGDTNGSVDTSSPLTSTSAPVLTRIEPGIGEPGDEVTLYGANFGMVRPALCLPLICHPCE